MPGSVRKDDKARQIALNIMGPPPSGLTDSFGKKKRYIKKKEKNNVQDLGFEGNKTNNFEEIGYR